MARVPPLLKRGRTRSTAEDSLPGPRPAPVQPALPQAGPAPGLIMEEEEHVEEDSTNEISRARDRSRGDDEIDAHAATPPRLEEKVVGNALVEILASPFSLARPTARVVSGSLQELIPKVAPDGKTLTYTYTYNAYLAVPVPPHNHPIISTPFSPPAPQRIHRPSTVHNSTSSSGSVPLSSFLPFPSPSDNHQTPGSGQESFESYESYEHLPPRVQAKVNWAEVLARTEVEEWAKDLKGRRSARPHGRKRRRLEINGGGGGGSVQDGLAKEGFSGRGQEELTDDSVTEEEHSSGQASGWITIRPPPMLYLAPLPECNSFTYLPPPSPGMLTPFTPLPSTNANPGSATDPDRTYPARGLSALRDFGHASGRVFYPSAIEGAGADVIRTLVGIPLTPGKGRKRRRSNSFDLHLYQSPLLDASGAIVPSPATMCDPSQPSHPMFPPDSQYPPNLYTVVDAETEALPNFVFWDETLGLDQDESEDEESPDKPDDLLEGPSVKVNAEEEDLLRSDLTHLDLRRPALPPRGIAKDPVSGVVQSIYDQTTRTTFTTQSDETVSIPSAIAAAMDVDKDEDDDAGGTLLNDAPGQATVEANGATLDDMTKAVKGAMRPMPLHLSGIDFAAFPMRPTADANDTAVAAPRSVTRGRGRGRGVTRGKRGGLLAGASDPLARVRRTEGVSSGPDGLGCTEEGALEAIGAGPADGNRAERIKQKMPLKAALSPFKLGGSESREAGLAAVTSEAAETDPCLDRNDSIVDIPERGKGRLASPDAMTCVEQDESPIDGHIETEDAETPDTWERLEDLLPVPHRVPINSSFTPDRYAVCDDFPTMSVPDGVEHPFHPSFARLCDVKPYMRVKWIIPIDGQVIIPHLTGRLAAHEDETARRKARQAIPAFVPSPARIDFDLQTTSRPSLNEIDATKEGIQPKTIRWTPAFLLEFWQLLLKLRKLGRYGQIAFTLSGPQPDPFLAPSTPDDLGEHLYVSAEPKTKSASSSQPPRRPVLGIHIKLFCDLTWALKIRLVIASIRFGTNDSFLRSTTSGLDSVAPGAGPGSVKARTLFAFRKLCLLGERGEVLIVA